MRNLFLKIALVFTLYAMVLISCEKDDNSQNNTTSTTDLLSLKVSTPPVLDGTIDDSWKQCQTLIGTATVPDLPDFAFFSGESYDFKIRSQYDGGKVYFLVEYNDPKDSKDRQSWYFDQGTKLWKQQNKFPANADDKFYEDKVAFLWPTATSETTDWNTLTCYSSCHSVNQTLGYSTTTKHFAKDGQVIDMWHWKRVRTEPFGMVDDQKIVPIVDLNNPTATEKADGGRASDDKTAGGYADNKQTLNNGVADVSVPKYIIPNGTNYYWITQTDIDNGTAKVITAVDANGILTYPGGSIDPSTGGYESGSGTKRFPSITLVGSFVGSRGDVQSFAKHTGSGWVIELSRDVSTTDATNDIQFDPTTSTMFGFAIFENAAIGHGIKPNLILKFAQ
jgi:hypothetical protein